MNKAMELSEHLLQIGGVLALAACGGGATDGVPTDNATEVAARATDLPVETFGVNASDCVEVQTMVLRPLLELAELLPEPWEPADAAYVFEYQGPDGLGLAPDGPTGMGVVLMSAFECAEGAITHGGPVAQADLTIAVQPPPFTHAGFVDLHLYVIESYTREELLADKLRSVGWPVRTANIEIEGQGDPLDPIWSSEVLAEGAVQWATQSSGNSALTQQRYTARAWHVTSQGTGYFEYRYAQELRGSVSPALCSLGTGTAAEETAMAGCGAPTTIVYPEAAWRAEFVFMPRVFPQPGHDCIFGGAAMC